MEKWTEAERDFTRSIELEPKDPLAYNNRALLYHYMMDVDPSTYDKAYADYSESIRLHQNAVYYYNRGFLSKVIIVKN